ncbi:MAG: thiamine diphosphokinase [Sulfitobacter sp.]
MKQIVHNIDPVVLVGGGEATSDVLHKVLAPGRICVAADSGAHLAHAAGVEVAAVIGDFDSIDQTILQDIPVSRHHPVTEQDSTDFEKALSRITAPVVLAVGFLGGRLDHQLAACHTLLRYADRPCILIGATEIMLIAPRDISLATQAGDVVSLFPLVPVQGQSSGLRWPIDGLKFAPDLRIGTSNVATGACRLQMEAPGMLLILPLRIIQPVVEALMQPNFARWSVP